MQPKNRFNELRRRASEYFEMLRLAARTVAGRRFWLLPLLVLLWPIGVVIQAQFSQRQEFEAIDAQNLLIGFPLVIIGIGLGGRIIAGEIDKRTLEIAYTVPGGAHRVWLSKMFAAMLILLACEAVLAIVAALLVGGYPIGALYGAFQGAVVYLIVAMGWATLTRSEATGGMLTVLTLLINHLFTGFGGVQIRLSPFWNPAKLDSEPVREVIAHTVQNRIGFALLVLALTGLTFSRAEKREKLLG